MAGSLRDFAWYFSMFVGVTIEGFGVLCTIYAFLTRHQRAPAVKAPVPSTDQKTESTDQDKESTDPKKED